MIIKCKRKPTVVEAFRYREKGKHTDVVSFCEGMFYYANNPEDPTQQTHMLKTPFGSVILNDGDYIVKQPGHKHYERYSNRDFHTKFDLARQNDAPLSPPSNDIPLPNIYTPTLCEEGLVATKVTTKTINQKIKITLPPIGELDNIGIINQSLRRTRD
jgi:hypothetical protein